MPEKKLRAPRAEIGLTKEKQDKIRSDMNGREVIRSAIQNIKEADMALGYIINYLGVEINEKPFQSGAIKNSEGHEINAKDADLIVWGSRIIANPKALKALHKEEGDSLQPPSSQLRTDLKGIEFATALASAGMKAIGRHSYRIMARSSERFQEASEISTASILAKQTRAWWNKGNRMPEGSQHHLPIDTSLKKSQSFLSKLDKSYGQSVEEIYRALNTLSSTPEHGGPSPSSAGGQKAPKCIVLNATDTIDGKDKQSFEQPGPQKGEGEQPTRHPQDSSGDDERVASAALSAKRAGSDTDSIEQYIESSSPSYKDWREEFRLFLGHGEEKQPDWSRPNRRYIHQDTYLPGQARHEVGVLVLAVDTSGSISEGLLSRFMAEVNKVNQDCAPNEIHVISCDCSVQAHDVFGPYDSIEAKAIGRGGTAFSPVFRFLKSSGISPACLVYFTDLECYDYGESPDYPVLWVKWPEPGKYSFQKDLSRAVPFGRIVLMD